MLEAWAAHRLSIAPAAAIPGGPALCVNER
jgi:hypothetical protein